MSKNIIQGKKGEELAARFMEAKGYTILERNFRSGRAEIDLILQKENLLVFAEVKLRKRTAYGMPEEAVDERKAELVINAADDYIYKKDWRGAIRFDIISISGENEISHFEDGFS